MASSVLGCVEPTQRAVIAVPAARRLGESRPLRFPPPLELATRDDAVVRIVGEVTCTGTLVAEDLVLTAHHCVAARDNEGRVLTRDLDPRQLTIELGGDYMPWGEVNVRAVVTPDCGYAYGDGDIALLVLSRKLIGMATAAPRLDGPPGRGEAFWPMGFGRCALSPPGIHRVARSDTNIERVSRDHFNAQAAICPGDSGGPALEPSGEVIGIVSRSVMDGDQSTRAPTLFTRVDRWRKLFAAAREIADGASPSELPPYRSCAETD